jgi:tetratricopeptide (TPR) repeat protein
MEPAAKEIEMVELKQLSRDAVPAALEKARHYRLLNERAEAESICRDILAVDPDNHDARVTLLLALTDQFRDKLGIAFTEARALARGLDDEYGRAYYEGIVCERRAKAHWRSAGHGQGPVAHYWFHEAMTHYELAIALKPPANDEAILRFNTCARILAAHPELAPPAEQPMAVEFLE